MPFIARASVHVSRHVNAHEAAIIAHICHTGRWECHSRNSGAISAARLGARGASSTEALLTACRLSLAAKKSVSLPGIENVPNLGGKPLDGASRPGRSRRSPATSSAPTRANPTTSPWRRGPVLSSFTPRFRAVSCYRNGPFVLAEMTISLCSLQARRAWQPAPSRCDCQNHARVGGHMCWNADPTAAVRGTSERHDCGLEEGYLLPPLGRTLTEPNQVRTTPVNRIRPVAFGFYDSHFCYLASDLTIMCPLFARV
jgi:hypothetical protein